MVVSSMRLPKYTGLSTPESSGPGTRSVSSSTVSFSMRNSSRPTSGRLPTNSVRNSAGKLLVMPTARITPGLELSIPGIMSASNSGWSEPARSIHGSRPWMPSSASKYRRSPTTLKFLGSLLQAPGQISASRRVPAAVPSLTHSSAPSSRLLVTNKWRPSKPTASCTPPPDGAFGPL